MKPITADSGAGRLLLALRAGGLTTAEIDERWPASGKHAIAGLVIANLAVKDGETYTLTAAGRAACPYRNPLAATANQPEVFTMPRGTLTQSMVLTAIVAAGADGINKDALAERFGATPKAIRNHLDRLKDEIVHANRGVYVARRYLEGTSAKQAAAYEAALPPSIGAHFTSPVDIDGVSLAVDHHDAADLSADSHAAQMALIEAPPRYAVAFPIDFHDSVDAAIAAAVYDYKPESLADAVVIVCTPLGRIEMRPVLVREPA